MRPVLCIMLTLFLADCNMGNDPVMNIYLANYDSVYYCDSAQFSPQKLKGGVWDDSVFNNRMFLLMGDKGHIVQLKPMTGFTPGGGNRAEAIDAFCSGFRKNGISYNMTVSDSAEKVYFQDITIMEYLQERRK